MVGWGNDLDSLILDNGHMASDLGLALEASEHGAGRDVASASFA